MATVEPAIDEGLANPVLNGPYDPPERHFVLGPNGPTGEILPGRRPSESYIPVPAPRKGRRNEQQTLALDVAGEHVERNTLINDIRIQVDRWRARSYPGVTPYSRKLLQHWAARGPEREDPMLFCQREAAETAIFLAEVAGRQGTPDFRARIAPANALHNEGLPRIGVKMATGTGKTVVMAMLIAWQTINKVHAPRDSRFSKRFLVVTPGITIRDRLRVLQPSDDGNYYRERDLVPHDLWDALRQARVVIVNYHAFLPRDSKEIQGVAANTRKILTAGKAVDPFRETPEAMVARVLRDLGGREGGEIVVLNDEAHHCYREKALEEPDPDATEREAKERNDEARVWYRGLQAIQHRVGLKAVYDLSATPFYLRGSGYSEGFIFPWVVSDFSLMDAIESGIVKIPRVPVDDDAAGELVTYLRLWDHVGERLPKRKTAKAATNPDWVPPQELEGALKSLHRSYETAFDRWEGGLAAHGEPPPVMIVVCPNTVVSKLVFDWIAGGEVEQPDGTVRLRAGELGLLSNVTDGEWTHRQRTMLIDSAQLESGEAMSDEFKKAAGQEIEAFKADHRRRFPGADVEKLTDEDLLREVMNTVGKKDRLGEHIRCVVSVSMLTEGWDANTVSHILGIRRFGSQLLCEQVVGRGLRRRTYAVNDAGRFDPEYAEVYGVPFMFIPSARPIPGPQPRELPEIVEALPERADLEIRFPKLDGYRLEIPDEDLRADFDAESRLHLTRSTVATWTRTAGVVGEIDEQELADVRHAREQRVAYAIARTLVRRMYTAHESTERPWLFPQLLGVTREWLRVCVTLDEDVPVGMLLLAEGTNLAAEKVRDSIMRIQDDRPEFLLPIVRRFDPEGSTAGVRFATRKGVIPATKSHLNGVVLDGPARWNTWEEAIAGLLEVDERVAAFVKNDHLGFAIPYVHKGRSHDYVPDFLARLTPQNDGIARTLIIEVSGSQKAPGPTEAKAGTARWQWCPAVNNHGGFGRWGYLEIADMGTARADLSAALDLLLAPAPAGPVPV